MHPIIIWLGLLAQAQVLKASNVNFYENKASPHKRICMLFCLCLR